MVRGRNRRWQLRLIQALKVESYVMLRISIEHTIPPYSKRSVSGPGI
jgi:hypothetical protein